jgi:hypothetical protein
MAFGIIFMANQEGRVDALFPRSSLMLGCTLMDRSHALGFLSCQCQMWSMIVGYVPSADNQIFFFQLFNLNFFTALTFSWHLIKTDSFCYQTHVASFND